MKFSAAKTLIKALGSKEFKQKESHKYVVPKTEFKQKTNIKINIGTKKETEEESKRDFHLFLDKKQKLSEEYGYGM